LCTSLPQPAPPQPYPLSLHDALPIYPQRQATLLEHGPEGELPRGRAAYLPRRRGWLNCVRDVFMSCESFALSPMLASWSVEATRSEEHTSELQSRENLVCRLLLEKKK